MIYFTLFANCIPVKGIKHSIVCDLQLYRYIYIPNEMYDFIAENKKSKEPFLDILNKYDSERDGIFKFINYLVDKEFGFMGESVDEFPELNLENWDFPGQISNSILDINNNSGYKFLDFLQQVNKMGCEAIMIRFYEDVSFEKVSLVLKEIDNCEFSFQSIEILAKYDKKRRGLLKKIINENVILTSIHLYDASSNRVFRVFDKQIKLTFSTDKQFLTKYCGVINSENLTSNIDLFTEAQQHNTCLNRKISIDVNGAIKNCPSMAKSYGNIKDTTLAEAIEKPGFKDMWFINKDQIAVCKDCEFRYICTDCRAYIENPDDIYSKPLKCGYNPYTAEWEEWSTNPLKQKAIEYYGMQELVKKEK
jgi:SPASM domain peptide maturase of grasp-with-spasm system